MTKFYEDLYEKLYSDHGYHSSEELKSTHYPSFFTGCLNPSGMDYTTVLDIGCSTGIGIKSFFEPLGKKCEGIDVSKTAIHKATERGVSAQVASIIDIPFDDNSFDLVCSTDVIEHLRPEDQEKAHRECFRTSKKYVAHKIANTPEGNLFAGEKLHLTCWSHEKWMEFFESLNLENWKLIYTITPEVWDKIGHDVYGPNGSVFRSEPCPYDHWIEHNTVVVFEKTS